MKKTISQALVLILIILCTSCGNATNYSIINQELEIKDIEKIEFRTLPSTKVCSNAEITDSFVSLLSEIKINPILHREATSTQNGMMFIAMIENTNGEQTEISFFDDYFIVNDKDAFRITEEDVGKINDYFEGIFGGNQN